MAAPAATKGRTRVAGKHTTFIGYVAPIPGHKNGWWQSWLPEALPDDTIGVHHDEAQAVRFLLQLERHRKRQL